MPSIYKFALAMLAPLALMQAADAFKDEPQGFRGIAWGTSIEEYADEMVRWGVSGDGESVYYRRRNDKMFVGKIRVEDVTYTFWRGGFSSSRMELSITSCESFSAIVIERFGRPDKESRAPTGEFRAHWLGAKTRIILSNAKFCSITFASAELEKEQKAIREAAKAEADAQRESDIRPDF